MNHLFKLVTVFALMFAIKSGAQPHFLNVTLMDNSSAIFTAELDRDSFMIGSWNKGAISTVATMCKKPILIPGSSSDFLLWQTTPENPKFFACNRDEVVPRLLNGERWEKLVSPQILLVFPEKKRWITESFLAKSRRLYSLWGMENGLPQCIAQYERNRAGNAFPYLAAAIAYRNGEYFVVAEKRVRRLAADSYRVLLFSIEPFTVLAETNTLGRAHAIKPGEQPGTFNARHFSTDYDYLLDTYQLAEGDNFALRKVNTERLSFLSHFPSPTVIEEVSAGFVFSVVNSPEVSLKTRDTDNILSLFQIPEHKFSSGLTALPRSNEVLAWYDNHLISCTIDGTKIERFDSYKYWENGEKSEGDT